MEIKSTSVGIPSIAARWLGPESFPKYLPASCSKLFLKADNEFECLTLISSEFHRDIPDGMHDFLKSDVLVMGKIKSSLFLNK